MNIFRKKISVDVEVYSMTGACGGVNITKLFPPRLSGRNQALLGEELLSGARCRSASVGGSNCAVNG